MNGRKTTAQELVVVHPSPLTKVVRSTRRKNLNTKNAKLIRNTSCLIPSPYARAVSFVSLHEGVDTSTPNGRLVFGTFASIAEFDLASLPLGLGAKQSGEPACWLGLGC